MIILLHQIGHPSVEPIRSANGILAAVMSHITQQSDTGGFSRCILPPGWGKSKLRLASELPGYCRQSLRDMKPDNNKVINTHYADAVPQRLSVISMALSMPRALLRVSSYSLDGMLSATMPAPAWM